MVTRNRTMKKSLCSAMVGLVMFVCCSATARVLIYEPFDYPDAPLNGQGGVLGTTGTWTTNDAGFAEGWWCHLEGELTGQFDDIGGGLNMFDGTVDNLPTSGGFVGSAGPEEQGSAFGTRDQTGNLDANIGLDPRVTATFQSGTTTWFSYVGAHADNRNQGSPTLMLCTDPTVNATRGLTMENSGNGIGGVGGPVRFNLQDVYPHYFSGGVHHQSPGGWLGGTFGGHDGIVTAFCSTASCDGLLDESNELRTQTMAWQISDDKGFGAANIVVGKIEWDADTGGEDIISVVRFLETDTLSEAAFDALITARPALSSANWPGNKPSLDQSQFDTLNISGLKFYVDEIRLATTFKEVVGGASTAASSPNVANAATDVPKKVVLSWTPGESADTHNIYFGEVFDDVNDADGGDPRGALVSPGQIDTRYDPGRLDFGTTYYWRVDEVNAAPDNTVFKGDVWSFTVEPIAIPITQITATASGSFGVSTPEKTIDGSGLADDLHGTVAGDMWISTGIPATMEYAFDRAYKLHELWIWNSNQSIEAFVGFGAKDVVIEHSLDGENWTVLEGVGPLAQAPGTEGYAHNSTIDFGGAVAQHVRVTVNSVQGIAPQASLSEVRFFFIPTFATGPDPASDATDVAPGTTLSWGRNGRDANRHEVYVGTNADDLALAGTVSESSFSTDDLDLVLGTTYTWRVDEVNEAMDPSVWTGDLWRFTTVDTLTVDDMESYRDAEFLEIWATWIDGFDDPANGALVGANPGNGDFSPESTIVHGGTQSLPIHYDNSAAAESEATRTFAVSQDWTRAGITQLVVWFYGTAGNSGQMYLKVNGTKIPFGGSAGNIALAEWQVWSVDLASLGMTLQSVRRLAVGIEGGGAGTLYIDDITLAP